MESTQNASKPIHLEATFQASPERVYELLINGAKFGDVTGKPGKGGGSEGAYFSLFGDWLQGRQIELVPNQRIVQAWRFMDWDPGVYSFVRFTLIPEGSGTKLVLDQEGVPAAFHEHVSTNWKPFYFDAFTRHFAN
jgi:activator of HSP90 ATPase